MTYSLSQAVTFSSIARMPFSGMKVNFCRQPSSAFLVRRSRASLTRVDSLPNSIELPAFHRVFPRHSNSTLVLPPFHQQPCPVTTPFSPFRFPLLCSCLSSPIPESRGSTRTASSSILYYILYLHTRSLLPPAHTPYHTPHCISPDGHSRDCLPPSTRYTHL